MSTIEHIDLVRRFYAAGPADDDAARAAFAAPDVVWHVPGDNPVSGRYQGYEEVFSTIGRRMQSLDDWRVGVSEVLANGDLVVATVDVVAARGDHQVACRGAHVFRLVAGRIAEAWGFVDDQAGLDALFAAEG